MELELASLGPFIELLPPDKKEDIRTKLTEKFFGQPEISEDDEGPVSSSALLKVIEKSLTLLVKNK